MFTLSNFNKIPLHDYVSESSMEVLWALLTLIDYGSLYTLFVYQGYDQIGKEQQQEAARLISSTARASCIETTDLVTELHAAQ